MKRVLLALALLGFGAGMACAVPTDLSDGVFIAHHDPAIVWSSDPPAGGWCGAYAQHAITSCDQQNPMVMGGSYDVWFVLAQWWDEAKTWCLSEFGFGAYDPAIYAFDSWGPCTPGLNLEISTPAWPGPMQGTAVTTTDIPWSGNFVPVYFFTGYAYYYPGQIPFGTDPASGFAGFINCLTPPQPFDADCLPALGINVPGAYCCSEPPVDEYPCCYDGEVCEVMTLARCQDLGGVWHPEWMDCGPPNPCDIQACCVGEECYEVNAHDCEGMGGVFMVDYPTCTPNPCLLPTAACCVGCDCYVANEPDCRDMGGIWYPDFEDCDPDPCTPSPTDNTSWGSIKAIYR